MVYGIPFPEIYAWTWGEIVDYITGVDKKRREELRTQALMNFRTANLIARMVSAQRGQKFNVMDEYEFLWTKEERDEIKVNSLMNSLLRKTSNVGSQPSTPNETQGGA